MRLFYFTIVSLLLIASHRADGAGTDFKTHVLPIFKNHCLGCHNPGEKKAGLDLSTFQSAMAGSSGGLIVKAGLPDSSPLMLAVDHHDDYVPMPLDKPKLSEKELLAIRNWISKGLIDRPGGKSTLREMSLKNAASMTRPSKAIFPSELPSIPLAKTVAKPPVIAMAVSPWSNLIAVSGHGQVLLFGSQDVEGTLSHLGTLRFNEGDIHDLRFSADGSLLLAAGGFGADSGRAVLYDVKIGKKIGDFGNEHDIVLSADISADKKLIAFGTPTKLVKVFSIESGKQLHEIKKHTDWVTAVRFSPDGKSLATGDRNGGIHVWESESAGIVYSLSEHKQKITALVWRFDGKLLGSASDDGKVILWDMNDGWATRSLSAHVADAESRYSRRTGVMDFAFLRNGDVVSTGRDRKIRYWNANGTPKGKPVSLPALPLAVGVGTLGDKVFVGDFGGGVRVLSPNDFSEQQSLIAK